MVTVVAAFWYSGASLGSASQVPVPAELLLAIQVATRHIMYIQNLIRIHLDSYQ
jgi:hypothetical protein